MQGATLDLSVAPAWFQTTWFLLLCVASGDLAGGWRFTGFRVRQVAAGMNARFDERLAERTRIAQELHDTLLQGFLSASMQVHVAKDTLPADSQIKPILTRALQLMGQVIEEGRNAVRGLRLSQMRLAGPGAGLRENSAGDPPWPAPMATKVEFRVIAEGQPQAAAPAAARRSLPDWPGGGDQRVSPCARRSQIEVELRYGSSQFRLVVRDDGCGIESEFCDRPGRTLGALWNAGDGRSAWAPRLQRVQQGLGGHRS